MNSSASYQYAPRVGLGLSSGKFLHLSPWYQTKKLPAVQAELYPGLKKILDISPLA